MGPGNWLGFPAFDWTDGSEEGVHKHEEIPQKGPCTHSPDFP